LNEIKDKLIERRNKMTEDDFVRAQYVITDLRELAHLTSDINGSQRLAWTPTWDKAIRWLKKKLRKEGAIVSVDSACNVWAKIEGESSDAIAIGSHIDSVANGGWLDGTLGVCAALGIIKKYGKNGVKPNKTIYFVCWADEEGARFGRSCIGSSAVSGSLDVKDIQNLRDKDGSSFQSVLSTTYHKDITDFPKAKAEASCRNLKRYAGLSS
jgi:N-carbamoyl-L-amino-acid hydrolase